MNKEQIKERNKEIIDLYLQGSLSIVQLGRKYGVSRQRISTILLQNGIEPKAIRTKKTENTKITELNEVIKQLKEKYAKQGKAYRESVGKQRLEILNLNNTLNYRNGQVKNLKEKIKELEEKLKEK